MNVHFKNAMSSSSYFVDIIHRPNTINIMNRCQAFKYALMPNGEQQRMMRRFAGSCRFVFNKALALQIERRERGEKHLSYAKLCNELTLWKAEEDTSWLEESPSQTLQQSLKNLDRAYQNFFAKRAEFPRFKKRYGRNSFRYPQGFKLDEANARIFLPKLGWIRYRKSRDIVGTIKNITVSYSGNTWYASVQTERDVESPKHESTRMVGVDVGVAKFATLSDGTVYLPVNSFKKNQAKLRMLQKSMSRKVKFSKNWKKAKGKVQLLHSKIANIRYDALHKVSTQISKNHAVIVIEDLKVRNMSKSASGSVELPGHNVKAKSGLNKSILDQGWSMFREQLEYKQAWRGGWVIAVPPQYTSQKCPECEHVSSDNRQTQARFACVSCLFEDNADLVAARNVLAAGHAVIACGEIALANSMKQEPAEVT